MVTLTDAQLKEIVEHAEAEPDQEVCGVVGGKGGTVERVYRARNVAKTPAKLFELHPKDFMDILDDLDAAGLDTLGFYHSHTHSSPYPSRTDVMNWNPEAYPDAVYFICSLAEPGRPEVRAFRFDRDIHLVEEPIRVV
jgi:proteasome lid subunit RPN8/RPN11